MAERRLFLDEALGERRGVVLLGGQPERLLVERPGHAYPRLGARFAARVLKLDRGLGLARLDLGDGLQGALRLKPERPAHNEGATLEVEITAEPQGAKAALATVLGEGSGAARLLAGAAMLEQRLQAFAPRTTIVVGGREARRAAEEAEAQALAAVHALPGGGSIAIEATRALAAVDVDLGASAGGRDAKRAARQANLAAIAETARLLRLKALGGLVVIDLVGRGHDGEALARAARDAFAPDQPGVAIGPVSRFGLLELALPRRLRPLADILCGEGGGPSADTLALRLLRAVEREALAEPGRRMIARARPEVVAAAEAIIQAQAWPLAGLCAFIADPALPPEATEAVRRD